MFVFHQIEPLTDGVITLRLKECVPIEVDRWADSYNFAICKGDSDVSVGHIHLRIGLNDNVYYGGNVGYGVNFTERGRGYAARALRLVPPVAKLHGMTELLITCAPNNIASIKTIENCGATYLGISDVPRWNDLYKRNIYKICRYSLEI